MRAGERACACPECGVVCQGLFDGCPDVWARGPRPVTLTTTASPATGGVTIRALQAASEPIIGRPSTSSPPPPKSPRNGFVGASPPSRGTAGISPPTDSADPRTELLQWFEDAFDDLRNELHAVVSTVTRQQAMLAELVDSRDAELRVVVAAESLPELAGEAAAKALANESGALAEVVGGYLDEFRNEAAASDERTVATMDAMRELLQRVELTAELNTEEARNEGAARLEALKASVTRQVRPIAADVAVLTAEVEAAQEREAARTRALKAAMTKQLQPMAARLDEAIERTDIQLADLRDRLDALAAPAAGSVAGPASKPKARRRPSTTPRS